jgi:DNA polymerase III alpha subunit (gram-positive type)
MPVDFLAIDTETTGLDSSTDQVIDICLILLDGELNQVDELNVFALPDPHVVVSPGAAKANGYTIEKWAAYNAVDQHELSKRVYEFIAKYSGLKLIAHNVPFDQGFLKQVYERHTLPDGLDKKPFGKTVGYHHIDTIPISLFMDHATQGAFRRSYSLANLTKDFGIEHEAAHTARSDIKACLDLLRHHKKIVQGLVPTATISQNGGMFSKIIAKVDSEANTWIFAQGKNAGKTVKAALQEDASYILHVLSFKDLSPEQRTYLEQSYQAHLGIK